MDKKITNGLDLLVHFEFITQKSSLSKKIHCDLTSVKGGGYPSHLFLASHHATQERDLRHQMYIATVEFGKELGSDDQGHTRLVKQRLHRRRQSVSNQHNRCLFACLSTRKMRFMMVLSTNHAITVSENLGNMRGNITICNLHI